MVNYPHNNLFNRGDTDRQLRIDFTGGIITNKEMHQGSFSLTESLCSEESLRFGSCESSVLTFKVHNVLTSLVGQELTVYEVLNGNTAEPFNYGKYKVQSDKPTADRKYRDVVAYDVMYDILNADVASWYNGLTFPCSIGYFRKKFLSYLKVEYVDTELINDGIYIQKTVEVEQLSGKQVINAICEINGCFGHINRQGKFEFVVLKPISTGLYPSETLYPSEILYPKEANSAELLPTSRYSACKYEDFETKFITGVQIRQEEDDIGATVGTTANVYVVEDNFLVYGKGHDELTTIANNLLSVIDNIYYRPIDYVKTNGKPYLEVGDNISVGTNEVIIETYILERTITAVKGQKDEFSAKGVETYPKELNGLNKQITQLKGKTNKLIRTVEETRLEMEDIEKGLSSMISITAGQIRSELSDTKSGLESSINQTAGQIRSEVSDVKSGLESQILQTANQIRSEVSDSNKDLQSQITQNAGSITSEITRAKNAENQLSTRITQTDEKIRTDVAATYETIDVVEEKVNNAVSESAGYTDTKLSLYSTTSQMNSAIEQSAGNINLSVDSKIQTTKEYIDESLGSYSTTEQVQSKIDLSKDGILASVSSTYETIYDANRSYEELEAMIQVNSDKIALKVGSSKVQSMIDLSLEELVLTSSQISLEGYTTINGGFSIDEDGNAILTDDSGWYYAKITSNGLVVTYDNPNYSGIYYSRIGDGVITLSDPWGTTVFANMLNGKLYTRCYSSEINGYAAIHEGNIGNYAGDLLSGALTSDIEADTNSSGNIKFNGKTAVSTTYFNSQIGYVEADISNLDDRITDLENRLGDLEVLLAGGEFVYLQMENYDGDEEARYWFVK